MKKLTPKQLEEKLKKMFYSSKYKTKQVGSVGSIKWFDFSKDLLRWIDEKRL